MTQTDTHMARKAHQETTYTNTELDNALAHKATVAYGDSQLALTPDQSITCLRPQVDNASALNNIMIQRTP